MVITTVEKNTGLWNRSPSNFGTGAKNFLDAAAWNFGSGSSEAHNVFSVLWTKLFWSRNQKSQDIGARTKKIRCPEPEILVPAPQPWKDKVFDESGAHSLPRTMRHTAGSVCCLVKHSTRRYLQNCCDAEARFAWSRSATHEVTSGVTSSRTEKVRCDETKRKKLKEINCCWPRRYRRRSGIGTTNCKALRIQLELIYKQALHEATTGRVGLWRKQKR